MTSFPAAPSANRWFARSGSLGVAGHLRYAASLLLHIGLGVVTLLIAVVTATDGNLAQNERLDVNDTQLWLAVLLWLVAFATLAVLWARRTRWGWLAPLIWALVGLPLAVSHARVETVPPSTACASAGRVELGMAPAGLEAPPPIAWCFDAGDGIREVAALGDTVYLAAASGELSALHGTSGEIRWQSEPGAASGAIAARPDLILGGGDTTVTAWDPTGRTLWTAATPGPVSSLAISDANGVYVACADGTILALDGATGAVRWVSLSPVTDAQLVISNRNLLAFDSRRAITVTVLDIGSGEVRGAWIYDLGPQTYLTPPVLTGKMLVAGYAILADDGRPVSGGAIGMEPVTGAILWDRPLESPVEIAPVNVGGAAFVLAHNGQLYRLEPHSGQDTRPREIIESRGLGSIDAARLLATDGRTVFIGQRSAGDDGGTVYGGIVTATDRTGAALWRFHLSEPPVLPVTMAEDFVFIPDGTALFAVRSPGPATVAATPVQ